MELNVSDERAASIMTVHRIEAVPGRSLLGDLLADREMMLAEVERLNEWIAKLEAALVSMCRQYAIWSDGAGGYCTGDMSALEDAFELLGWDEPHAMPEDCCDEPGCTRRASCGWPAADGKYRRTCHEHNRGE